MESCKLYQDDEKIKAEAFPFFYFPALSLGRFFY